MQRIDGCGDAHLRRLRFRRGDIVGVAREVSDPDTGVVLEVVAAKLVQQVRVEGPIHPAQRYPAVHDVQKEPMVGREARAAAANREGRFVPEWTGEVVEQPIPVHSAGDGEEDRDVRRDQPGGRVVPCTQSIDGAALDLWVHH